MHRPDTLRRPAAPPVVPPPLPEELPQQAPPGRISLFFARLVRDVKIGGVCLLVGLLVGQSGLLDGDHRQSSTLASLFPEQTESAESVDPAIVQQSSQQVRGSERSQYAGGQSEPTDPVVDWRESPTIPAIITTEAPAGDRLASATELTEPQEVADPSESESSELIAAEEIKTEPIVTRSIDGESSLAAQTASSHEASASPPESESPPELPPKSQTAEPSPPLIASSSVAESIKSMMTVASQSSLMHPSSEDATCEEMESHGTLLKWADTPADAYRVANEQRKLVFMIHVSGNFEIPGFT